MVDFNKLRALRKSQSVPEKYPTVGRSTRAKRRNDLEVLANLEAKALLKPGQRVNRFIATRPRGKRLQHNVELDN